MLQGTPGRVREYYDEHPISEAHVLAALAGQGQADSPTADDLFAFDQDHYGGLSAVDGLARRAGIGAASRVLDVCAGLGGPARFLASRRGSSVVALELHAGRAAGAARLHRPGTPARARGLHGDRDRGSIRRMARDRAPTARAAPGPSAARRGAIRPPALRGVRPAPRVLREADRNGQARWRTLHRYPMIVDRARTDQRRKRFRRSCRPPSTFSRSTCPASEDGSMRTDGDAAFPLTFARTSPRP